MASALRRRSQPRAPVAEPLPLQAFLTQAEHAAACRPFPRSFLRIVTVAFFEFASYKRRSYLLPLWPASALLLAWWLLNRIVPRLGHRLGDLIYRAAVGACLLLAAANFLFIPAYELHGCGAPLMPRDFLRWPSAGFAGESSINSGQTESYREVAEQINRLTNTSAPLYVLGIPGCAGTIRLLSGSLRSAIAPTGGRPRHWLHHRGRKQMGTCKAPHPRTDSASTHSLR